MSPTMEQESRLETEYVDELGLAGVLESLSRICHEKAEHLRVNWQDDYAARLWEQDARTLDRATEKVQTS